MSGSKLLILGAGGWGRNYVRASLKDKSWDVVGFVDVDPNVHRTLVEEHSVPESKIFTNASEALEQLKPDAITCSIPNPQRFPILVKAVEKGIHILVDKPVVHTAEQLKALLKAHQNSKAVFSVAENYRLFPQVKFMREAITKDLVEELGQISVRFAKNTKFMGDKFYGRLEGWKAVGLEDVIHYADMFRYLAGANPTELFSWGWRHPWNIGKGFMAIQANLKFSNGVHTSYYGTWDVPINLTPWEGEWLLEFRNGCILWNRIEGKVEVFNQEGRRIAFGPEGFGNEKPHDSLETHSEDSIDLISETSMDEVFTAFTRAVKSGAEVYCPLEDNAYSQAVALALEHSCLANVVVLFKDYLKSEGLDAFLKLAD